MINFGIWLLRNFLLTILPLCNPWWMCFEPWVFIELAISVFFLYESRKREQIHWTSKQLHGRKRGRARVYFSRHSHFFYSTFPSSPHFMFLIELYEERVSTCLSVGLSALGPKILNIVILFSSPLLSTILFSTPSPSSQCSISLPSFVRRES